MNSYPSRPSELGIRPAPAVSNQLLVGAFTWMAAGVLLSAAVAFLVAQNATAVQSVARLWLPIAFAQLGLALGIQWLMPRLSASVALLLFFVYAASVGLTAGVILTIYTGQSV